MGAPTWPQAPRRSARPGQAGARLYNPSGAGRASEGAAEGAEEGGEGIQQAGDGGHEIEDRADKRSQRAGRVAGDVERDRTGGDDAAQHVEVDGADREVEHAARGRPDALW